jgi:hypothetical protein
MGMRAVMYLNDKDRKSEIALMTKKNPLVSNIVGDRTTYEFMKLVMVVCEDHYRQGEIYTVKWLKDNFQSTHGAVSAKKMKTLFR